MPDWLADGWDWLLHALNANREVPADRLLARLLLAFVLGCAIALLYRLTHRRGAPEATNFVTTLVMLAVLMAVVTQVIGDNTARAFSLVGALAIVRFRTVVEDTRDIAFVVFAVAVGMAVGAGYPAVAAGTLCVVGAAAALVRPRGSEIAERWNLSVRVGAGATPEAPLEEVFRKHLDEARLVATSTTRQGSAFDLTYHIRLRPRSTPTSFAAELNLVAGLQNVELRRL